MYAKVKYSDIPQDEGRGRHPVRHVQKQFWGASKFLYGTNLRNWTSLHFDFLSQDDGTAEIVCSLGFRYGGTTNGGYSTGTAYFDNVSVVKVTDELFMQEGEHIRLFVEPSQVYASASQITEWIANLDRMYESYADLVGATPHEGASWRSFRRAGSKAVIGRWRAIPSCGAATIRPSPRPSRSWRSTAPGASA